MLTGFLKLMGLLILMLMQKGLLMPRGFLRAILILTDLWMLKGLLRRLPMRKD
jgi:hypothetical protein